MHSQDINGSRSRIDSTIPDRSVAHVSLSLMSLSTSSTVPCRQPTNLASEMMWTKPREAAPEKEVIEAGHK